MATYLVLGNFTEQGLHKVKDTVKRTEAYAAMLEHGVRDATLAQLAP